MHLSVTDGLSRQRFDVAQSMNIDQHIRQICIDCINLPAQRRGSKHSTPARDVLYASRLHQRRHDHDDDDDDSCSMRTYVHTSILLGVRASSLGSGVVPRGPTFKIPLPRSCRPKRAKFHRHRSVEPSRSLGFDNVDTARTDI